MRSWLLTLFALTLGGAYAHAGQVVTMNLVDANGNAAPAGTVTLEDSPYGLVLTPDLHGLRPGAHGFHVHQNPSCAAAEKDGKEIAALGAGGHFDPAGSGRHGTPWGTGHLGDLPVLSVAADGTATIPVLAPRLAQEKVKGRALMIHAGGDNYADTPKKLGGGGARIACGVID